MTVCPRTPRRGARSGSGEKFSARAARWGHAWRQPLRSRDLRDRGPRGRGSRARWPSPLRSPEGGSDGTAPQARSTAATAARTPGLGVTAQLSCPSRAGHRAVEAGAAAHAVGRPRERRRPASDRGSPEVGRASVMGRDVVQEAAPRRQPRPLLLPKGPKLALHGVEARRLTPDELVELQQVVLQEGQLDL